LSLASRYRLAREAFAHTASYDTGISSWLDTHSEISLEATYASSDAPME
jgi:AICAR transformylase/IMP cyclohydrolase PurH